RFRPRRLRRRPAAQGIRLGALGRRPRKPPSCAAFCDYCPASGKQLFDHRGTCVGEGVNAADTGGAELVLVQTRDVTGPEATQVYAAAVELQMPDMWRDLLLWFCYAGIFLPWV